MAANRVQEVFVGTIDNTTLAVTVPNIGQSGNAVYVVHIKQGTATGTSPTLAMKVAAGMDSDGSDAATVNTTTATGTVGASRTVFTNILEPYITLTPVLFNTNNSFAACEVSLVSTSPDS